MLATLAAGCSADTDEPEQMPTATATTRVALGGSETTFCGVSLGYSDPVIIDAVDRTEIELPLGLGTYYVRVSDDCEHGATAVEAAPASSANITERLPQPDNIGLIKIDVLQLTGGLEIATTDRPTRAIKFREIR